MKKSDVHNMLHFAKLVNLMDDKSRVKFYKEISSAKAGKVKISKKTTQEINASNRLVSLSKDGTRWSERLYKQG